MTKIDTWKCDMCGKVFMKGDSQFNVCSEAHIFLAGASMYDQDEKIDLIDLCLPCKNALSDAINNVIDIQ